MYYVLYYSIDTKQWSIQHECSSEGEAYTIANSLQIFLAGPIKIVKTVKILN